LLQGSKERAKPGAIVLIAESLFPRATLADLLGTGAKLS